MSTQIKDMSRYSLPPNAALLPEVLTLKLANWNPMQYDAEMIRYDVRWLRVYGGMGGRFDREDWVADLEGLSVCIHDYHWNGESFGANHGTMDNACYQELALALRFGRLKETEMISKLETLRNGLAKLETVLAKNGDTK